MQNWEYIFVDLTSGFAQMPQLQRSDKIIDRMNEYGKQGWDCISIQEQKNLHVVAYFKRPA